jgi:hypothetical protein
MGAKRTFMLPGYPTRTSFTREGCAMTGAIISWQ